MSSKPKLIQGPIGKTIINLTIPMYFGILSMVAFNIADTYFVGKLGPNPLAALTFTFPVIMVITSIALGIGVGTSTVLSKEIGKGNLENVKKIATHSILLAVSLVFLFILLGYFTIEPLFRALGAKKEILPLITDYMKIWYFGILFVVVPMVGNNAIRAAGDMKTPAMIMIAATIMNIVLDPIFIFGYSFIPKMGIKGAAYATVLSRALTFILSIYVLYFREKVITFRYFQIRSILDSWKKVLYISIPVIGSRLIFPFATGIITKLIATFGTLAVASYGIATRLEFFSLSLLMSLATALNPFIGQNFGANRIDRVDDGISFSFKFSIINGIFFAILFYFFKIDVATSFNKDPKVIEYVCLYLTIVPISYIFNGFIFVSTSALTVLNKPYLSAAMSFAGFFIFTIPFSFLLKNIYGLKGIYYSFFIGFTISGIISIFLIKSVVNRLKS